MKFFFPFLFAVSNCLFANFSDFDCYQGKCTRAEIEERLGMFLQKDGAIGNYFSLSNDAFKLFNSEGQVEYELKLTSEAAAKQIAKRQSLIGVKVAIDPGHLGGAYATLEDRFIDIPLSLERANPIRFDEGTLCFLTAVYLKLLLEKEGAIVMLTRDRIGSGVYEDDFFDWLKKNTQLWMGEGGSLKKIFGKYYNPLDLRARAKKINEFAPDLTVVIHYNATEIEGNVPSNHNVSPLNYNMVFVPGAFCHNELIDRDSRYEFLRLLVSNDLHCSLSLSKAVLDKLGEHLQVPPISKHDGANYLNRVGMKVHEGIYARNLALTRLIHGPVCYGETLIQNNIDECVKLAKNDFVIGGQQCSSRIKQVAEGYFEGIKEYLLTSGIDRKID